MSYRIGQGFDVHKFQEERTLYLGGVEINHKGLAGHSDADVLLHALIDALLGAAALGDIGEFFPDNDQAYRNIRSTVLLKNVVDNINKSGWNIENIDATVICESPRISNYKKEIINVISSITGVKEDAVMIKGKTTEKLGFTGRSEGIAAMAVVLLKRRNP